MAMTKVTPLVPYHDNGSGYNLIRLKSVYAENKNGKPEYEYCSYDFCTYSFTTIDSIGSYTQVNMTAYIRAGAYVSGSGVYLWKPRIQNIKLTYNDSNLNIITPYESTVSYESNSSANDLSYSSATVGNKTEQVFPYLNISFKVRHNIDGTPNIYKGLNLYMSAECAMPLLAETKTEASLDNTYGFRTLPYQARITGAGSFYNQTSIDDGTATSFTLQVNKTTDIYADAYIPGEDGTIQHVTCTQRLCLSTNGVDADIIPYTEVDCETANVTLTVTAAIQDALLAWCNDAASKPIYYILETTYCGYTHYFAAKRYFLVANAEPTIAFDYSDANGTTIKLTRNPSTWIKNASIIHYSLTPHPKKHATIVSQYVKCGTYSSTESGEGTIDEPNGDYIEVGCTDSRGFTATKTIKPHKVYDYFKPTALIKCSNMTGDGSVKLSFSGKFKNVDFANTSNTLKLEYRYKKANDADYGDWITIDTINESSVDSSGNYSCSVVLENLDYRESYKYQSRITDLINSVPSIVIDGVSIPIFDWSETDFNFNVPVTIEGKAAERICEQGEEGIWTYILWDSGLCECWGTYSNDVTLSNSEGALYYSDDVVINYPANHPNFENVLLSGGGNGASWVCTTEGCSESRVAFKVIGASSGSAKVNVNIHAWGFWK